MRFGLVCVMVIIIFLLIEVGAVKAQPYRQLSLEDFQGPIKHSGDVVAETACSISLKYDVHARDGYYSLTFYVGLEVDKQRSWLDRSRLNSPGKLAEILKHEQGHYIITYFEQQELLRTFTRTRFGNNYKDEVSQIFERIHAKYQQLNRDYDEDTGNSRNVIQQSSWDKYFQRRLAYMPPVSS